MSTNNRTVLVTGGAGYVGSILCSRLLEHGFHVKVLDTCWYGETALASVERHSNFSLTIGDIRNQEDVTQALTGCTDVIHLACISNDPSYDLDPLLGEEINFRAFEPLVQAAKSSGVSRFIYASSSSVYGVKEEDRVTEDLPLEPLTDYSRYKALCEEILTTYASADFTVVTVRPATVCGVSPRQRLDLVVNILVNHAFNKGVIRVLGGAQFRPNLHIEDMCRAYVQLLNEPSQLIQGETFNVGGINHTVHELAEIVRQNVSRTTEIRVEPTNDNRSYRISSEHIRDKIGFTPRMGVPEAVRDLVAAFESRAITNSFEDPRYFNIQMMNEILGAAK